MLRNAVTTLHFAAMTIRSCSRLTLLTAAAISGVTPGARVDRTDVVVSSASSQSRKPPTVRWAIGAKAAASWLSTMSRETSSASYGTSKSSRKVFSGRSATGLDQIGACFLLSR